MIVSPFTPLFFPSEKFDGIDGRYIQTFATSDEILIEILRDTSEQLQGSCRVFKEPGHRSLFQIPFNTWQINSEKVLYFATLNLAPGYYSVYLYGKKSTMFRVTDDPIELARTTLIQYSMNSNRHRTDAVFFIDGMQRFFDFRVPGGFKDSGWAFGVEGEQFVTESADIVQLYGLDSVQKKFTLGLSEGCPVWFGELLNRILTCSYVYFDGERYARKETATPELNAVQEGVNSFVFTQNLQRVTMIDPILYKTHQAIMRRVDDTTYRSTSENINRLIN